MVNLLTWILGLAEFGEANLKSIRKTLAIALLCVTVEIDGA